MNLGPGYSPDPELLVSGEWNPWGGINLKLQVEGRGMRNQRLLLGGGGGKNIWRTIKNTCYPPYAEVHICYGICFAIGT